MYARIVSVFLGVLLLASCAAARTTANVAALPVKAGFAAGKGVYLTGKGIYKIGEGVYKVGSVPVKITAEALETTSEVLILTKRFVTTAGTIAETSYRIRRAELDAQLAALKQARNIVEVIIDVPRA